VTETVADTLNRANHGSDAQWEAESEKTAPGEPAA